jgi:hypothetical protein
MIHIFKAQDGKWTYCPRVVRHWPAFYQSGQFETKEQAREAVAQDPTCKGKPVKVETGFFGFG